MNFYINKLPPGNAKGSEEWTVYFDYGTVDVVDNDICDDGRDDEGNALPLDHFFPRDSDDQVK
jgi:hypothetical protein